MLNPERGSTKVLICLFIYLFFLFGHDEKFSPLSQLFDRKRGLLLKKKKWSAKKILLFLIWLLVLVCCTDYVILECYI